MEATRYRPVAGNRHVQPLRMSRHDQIDAVQH
jgi:hypothetical protein